jgi:hypothetical protein
MCDTKRSLVHVNVLNVQAQTQHEIQSIRMHIL